MNEFMYNDIKSEEPLYNAKQVDVAFVVGVVFGFIFGFSVSAYTFAL